MVSKYGYTKRSYSSISYTSEFYDAYWNQANLRRWRPRVLIYDFTGTTLLHDYNSFSSDSSNDINLQYCNCQEQLGNTGNFSLRIRDDERSIDRSKVGNANKVVIQMAQHTNGPWFNIHSGYVENMKVMRNRMDGLEYGLSGFGSGIIIQETLSSFKKAAYPVSLVSTKPDINDPNMKTYNLVKAILTDTKHLVSSKVSIKDKGGFDIDTFISKDVDVFLPEIKTNYQPAARTIDFVNERAGSIWGVWPTDQVFVHYPGAVSSKVTLKTFKENEKFADIASQTSYFFGNWDYNMPISSDSFGNVLVSIAGTEPVPGSLSNNQGDPQTGGDPIGDEEPCQTIPITIPFLKIIGVILQKVGPLTEKFAKGLLYANLNGKPSKDPIATFKFDLGHLIDNIPAPCYSEDISQTSINSSSQIQVGNSVFMSVQATSQNSINNQGNNIVWMHNGTIIVGNPTPSGSRPNTSPAPGDEPKPPFTIDPDSPTYTYATFYNYRTKVIAKDPLSIARYGEVERFVDINWTTDFRTVNDLLMLMLEYTAKPKMIFNIEKVSIPTNNPFNVGKTVNVIDVIAGLAQGTNTVADITSVGYEFDSNSPDSAIGTYFCDLGIGSLYDYLQHEDLLVNPIQELSCKPFLV
ncbi:MAG: hypothetical protein L0H53_00785 [Candidatus Nitrosocosmicus sp.]|nr:hypothetical protein [Candidatus Nitrosocosmicus sp.]MDN5865953.1 hypothetical protein [Candidatus Nitrosocosmicus sp.]